MHQNEEDLGGDAKFISIWASNAIAIIYYAAALYPPKDASIHHKPDEPHAFPIRPFHFNNFHGTTNSHKKTTQLSNSSSQRVCFLSCIALGTIKYK
jgi:hypothetical protein